LVFDIAVELEDIAESGIPMKVQMEAFHGALGAALLAMLISILSEGDCHKTSHLTIQRAC
jgi:hypothetical protein